MGQKERVLEFSPSLSIRSLCLCTLERAEKIGRNNAFSSSPPSVYSSSSGGRSVLQAFAFCFGRRRRLFALLFSPFHSALPRCLGRGGGGRWDRKITKGHCDRRRRNGRKKKERKVFRSRPFDSCSLSLSSFPCNPEVAPSLHPSLAFESGKGREQFDDSEMRKG